ncbi:hypothetical protein QR98_0057590 [Sarcoptes scabiei]|uniref:Poly(A) RNA polymerase mitochondrial-like central palm domain-containing protein n=1 Tax=Sarcoptes scabiei TaxID=52283 RepID=A0A132A9Z3_SARSC|nr:hypothetical protein QR98_0057590 [Sarcoptes scabiei]
MTRHSFIQIDHRQCRTFSRNLNFLDLINTNKTEISSSSSSRGNFSHLTKNVLSDNLKIKIDRIWNYTYRRRQFVLARLNQLNDIDQIQSRCDFHQHSLPIFKFFHLVLLLLVSLGDASSDLDLVLLHSNHKNDHRINFSAPEIKSERDQIQLCLSLIADIIRNFTPNFSQINRILRARIPIVKMTFDLAPIEIDVSIELSPETAHHGLIMANYLHYCQSVSPIIRELFYFLKQWSKQHTISLLEGKSFNKPDYSPLYIENPMEKDLNVCKNVSGVEFKKLLLHGYNSIDAMHCRDFHLIDLLDPEYFKLLEKNSKPNQKRN